MLINVHLYRKYEYKPVINNKKINDHLSPPFNLTTFYFHQISFWPLNFDHFSFWPLLILTTFHFDYFSRLFILATFHFHHFSFRPLYILTTFYFDHLVTTFCFDHFLFWPLRPEWSYPESFVKIWLHLAEILRCKIAKSKRSLCSSLSLSQKQRLLSTLRG